ncbi:MAG: transcriptional accessory protein Tex/SPT6 [Algoriphagus sp.]|jgi:transcriptional accessory protein Tex/SPT6
MNSLEMRNYINQNKYGADSLDLPSLKHILFELAKSKRKKRNNFETLSFDRIVNSMTNLTYKK